MTLRGPDRDRHEIHSHRHPAGVPARADATVPDGRAHLVIYGEAETIDADPLRAELTAQIFAAMSGAEPADPATLVDTLNEQQRTVLRITPAKAMYMG